MNMKKREVLKKEVSEKCSHYLARGALLWGPLYTTGVSGMAYAIAPSITGDALAYTDVLLSSLIVCPSLGAAGGYIRWRLIKPRPVDSAGEKSPKRRTAIHRFRATRRAAHRKAA